MRRATSGAVGRAPALPQPVRDVEAHAVLAGQQLRPALGDAPQDGVDQLGEAMGAAVAAGDLHGQVDDGVGRHVEADELGGAGRAGSATGGPWSAGSGRSRKALSTCSSSPCRRSTVAATARASARSRASMAATSGRAETSASTCSRGRLSMSTPATRCTASLRAARPAGGLLGLGAFWDAFGLAGTWRRFHTGEPRYSPAQVCGLAPIPASGIRRAGWPDLGAGCAGQPLINERHREGGLVMSTLAKTAILSVALLAAGGTASSVSAQQSALRCGIAWPPRSRAWRAPARPMPRNTAATSARARVRILLCMQAHDDQLGIKCQFALYRARAISTGP